MSLTLSTSRAPTTAKSVLLSVVLMAIFWSSPVSACTITPANINLGTVPSFTASATAQTSSSVTTYSCPGSVLTIGTSDYLEATFTTNFTLSRPAPVDSVPFQLCRNASCSQTIANGGTIRWDSSALIAVLNSGSAGTLSLWARTSPSAQLSPGTYTGNISIRWEWDICTVGVGACFTRIRSGTTTALTVTLVVSNDCVLTAPNISFGSAAFVSSFTPVTRTIGARCSKNLPYTITLSNGGNFNVTRGMANGGNILRYDIYYPSNSSTRWTSVSSANATTNAGSHTGLAQQTYTYRAEIVPGQATPPPGNYSDTITLNINF